MEETQALVSGHFVCRSQMLPNSLLPIHDRQGSHMGTGSNLCIQSHVNLCIQSHVQEVIHVSKELPLHRTPRQIPTPLWTLSHESHH